MNVRITTKSDELLYNYCDNLLRKINIHYYYHYYY